MADNKISDLPSNAALTDSDLLELEQPGETAGTRSRKGTLATLLAWILGKTHGMTAAINEAKATDIASAATADIAAAAGNLVHITGTTTITALGTVQAGTRRKVVFDGILTLTHHATSLILPTGANITTAAGDAAEFTSEGGGNWRCTGYLRANGSSLTGGGGASTTQAGECISGLIVTPADGDYRIVVKAPHGGTITEVTTISASGSCTLTVKINTTALGGTANSVTSSEQSQAHSSANVFSAGDDIVLTVSSNAACSKMTFTIKYTRTLS